MKAVLRRTSGPLAPIEPDEPDLVAGDLVVDTRAHCASVKGERSRSLPVNTTFSCT